MADLTFAQVFGADFGTDISGTRFGNSIIISLDNFENYDSDPNTQSAGELLNGLGINDMAAFGATVDAEQSGAARKILYCILLGIMQKQAVNINDDPTQKIFIAEQAARLGVGARSGQIQRSFLVSFFTDSNITGTPDVDDL